MRAKLVEFYGSQPRCVVAPEARGGAYYWGREIAKLGHTVRFDIVLLPLFAASRVRYELCHDEATTSSSGAAGSTFNVA
jgi:hypothetical protein